MRVNSCSTSRVAALPRAWLLYRLSTYLTYVTLRYLPSQADGSQAERVRPPDEMYDGPQKTTVRHGM